MNAGSAAGLHIVRGSSQARHEVGPTLRDRRQAPVSVFPATGKGVDQRQLQAVGGEPAIERLGGDDVGPNAFDHVEACLCGGRKAICERPFREQEVEVRREGGRPGHELDDRVPGSGVASNLPSP